MRAKNRIETIKYIQLKDTHLQFYSCYFKLQLFNIQILYFDNRN